MGGDMTALSVDISVEFGNPLDVIEKAAFERDIPFDRVDSGEVHLNVKGGWRDAVLWFAWRPEFRTLQMGATLDLKAQSGKFDDASRLVALVNENLWIGHFDLWSDDGSIVYRHAVVLSRGCELEDEQVEVLIKNAIDAYERFYPAFNFLVWAGKSPREALDAALFETVGNA